MSSIYKKGRDGYYYYQAYVYNLESKKKDKRVFHALRTKDLNEARSKQHELDMQYENQSYIDSNSMKPPINFGPRLTIVIIITTIALTIFIGTFFKTNTTKQNRSVSIAPKKTRTFDKRNDLTPAKPIISNQIDTVIESIPEIIIKDPEPKLKEPKVIIPKYTVERVTRLSGAFDQGKVYVTIDEKSSSDSQLLLCKELVKRYNEFSNILICLYANNRSGKALAQGNDETVSLEEQKQFWLAMYTYNSVEGEYFDNNPSGYLGTY